MNIFLRELKAHRRSLIIWCIGILLVVVSAMGKFSAYTQTGQSMNDMLSGIPKAIKGVLGMGGLNLTTLSGFYGMFLLYLLLMAGIHASMLGTGIISKEERDKTTEFLIVKPVSRTGVITSKLLAALFNIAVFNIATLIFSLAIVGKYANGQNISGEICLFMTAMFFVQLLFLTIGTAVAAVGKRPKTAASKAMAILLSTYLIASVISIYDKLDFLKYITPFKYFEAEKIIDTNSLDPVFIVLSLVISAVLVYLTYSGFNKRDLKI